jgi:hypothetical protein
METRDDDIEFDFFDDEPATAETQSQPRVRLRRGTGGPAGPSHGFVPILRLAAFVVLVIVVVLVFGLLLQSCASSSRHSSYASYMKKVDAIAVQSTSNGKQVASALTALKVQDIVSKLQGIADNEQQNVQAAERLDRWAGWRREPLPRPVAQLRRRASRALASCSRRPPARRTTPPTRTCSPSRRPPARERRDLGRLLPRATLQQLTHDGVSGVIVPESSRSRTRSSRRTRWRSCCSGSAVPPPVARSWPARHEHRLGEGEPGGKEASASASLNTITASTDTRSRSPSRPGDPGDSHPGHATITKDEVGLDREDAADPAHQPGESVTVTFTDLGVVADRDPGDAQGRRQSRRPKTDNNSARYNIILAAGVACRDGRLGDRSGGDRRRRCSPPPASSSPDRVGVRAACARRSASSWRARTWSFAVALQGRIDDLHRAVDEVAASLARVDQAWTTRSRTRRSSATTRTRTRAATVRVAALLDGSRSGVVVTAIQGRDYAHLRRSLIAAASVALARGAGGGRARDGPLAAVRDRATVPRTVRFPSVQQVLVLNAASSRSTCAGRRAHVLVFWEGGGGRRARPITRVGHADIRGRTIRLVNYVASRGGCSGRFAARCCA